jgi:hypothetical protein
MDVEEGLKYFRAWYVEPINMMRPNINGGFIAFMTALILFERLIDAKLKLEGQPRDQQTKQQRMAQELGITLYQQKIFWNMFRDGLAHQGMPLIGKTKYMFHSIFYDYPLFGTYNGNPYLFIDPWKFTDRILTEFLKDPRLIVASDSFPFASVGPIDFDQLAIEPLDSE